jgi:hypothetical protein
MITPFKAELYFSFTESTQLFCSLAWLLLEQPDCIFRHRFLRGADLGHRRRSLAPIEGSQGSNIQHHLRPRETAAFDQFGRQVRQSVAEGGTQLGFEQSAPAAGAVWPPVESLESSCQQFWPCQHWRGEIIYFLN